MSLETESSDIPMRITKAAIDAARAECERRRNERREVGTPDDDLYAPMDGVVIARGVTWADVDDVRDEWLWGMRLALRADGTLVVEQLDTEEQSLTRNEVRRAVFMYSAVNAGNDMTARTDANLNCGRHGSRTPGVVLDELVDPPTYQRVPRVIVEVFCESDPSFVEIFRIVAGYFRDNATVVSVVVFKFFEPRSPARTDGLLEVPALAMAFALSNVQDRTSLIRIVEIESFGNADISPTVMDRIVAGMGNPDFDRLTRVLEDRLRQPTLPVVITSADPFPSLASMQSPTEGAGPQLFSVRIPLPLAPMTFDLVTLFARAIEGRHADDITCRIAQAAQAEGTQAAAAVSAADVGRV